MTQYHTRSFQNHAFYSFQIWVIFKSVYSNSDVKFDNINQPSHIISCVLNNVQLIISKKVTSAEGIYRKAVLCITTITFSRRLCLLCSAGKLAVQVALNIAMEFIYKKCQRHKGSKGWALHVLIVQRPIMSGFSDHGPPSLYNDSRQLEWGWVPSWKYLYCNSFAFTLGMEPQESLLMRQMKRDDM